MPAWPKVSTRYLLCRNDRLFPAAWVRRVVRDRLHISPDEIDSGHTPALSRQRSSPTGSTVTEWGRTSGSHSSERGRRLQSL